MDALEERAVNQEKAEKLDTKLSRQFDMLPGDPAPHDERGDEDEYAEAFGEFMRFGMSDMSTEGRKLMATRRQDVKNAALGVGSGSIGGYTVPPAFRAVMVETMKAYGVMLSESEFRNNFV